LKKEEELLELLAIIIITWSITSLIITTTSITNIIITVE